MFEDRPEDLRGDEAELFASGTLLLESENTPLAPAQMETVDARHVRLTLVEGRYHQVRRMFAATGNRVLSLHRSRTGNLDLSGLEPGQWRIVPREEANEKLFDLAPSG